MTTRELWIGWTTPGGFGPERFVGEMWAGLVRQNLRDGRFDDDDIAGVEVFSYPSALATVFELRVALTVGDHPEKSLKEVISSMPWIGDDEIYLDRRFEHLKAWTLQELVFDAESTETRGQDRAVFAHFTGSLGYMGRTVAAIQSITADQARDFATHYLAPERARAVLLEPMAGNPAAIVANAGGPAVLAPAPDADLSPPAIAPLEPIRFLHDFHRVTLPNGLETIIVRRPGASVVTAALGVHGGWDSAALGVGAASRYAMKMYFDESPGDFGIDVAFGNHWDLSTISATAGAGNLDRALEMVVFALRSYDVEWPDDKFQDTILPFMKRQEGGAVGRFEHSYRDRSLSRPSVGYVADRRPDRGDEEGRYRRLARAGVQSRERVTGDRRRCRSEEGRSGGARGVRQLETRGRRRGATRSISCIGAGGRQRSARSLERVSDRSPSRRHPGLVAYGLSAAAP